MDDKTLDFVKRLAKAMAAQFGGNCEVVVHDLNTGDPERTIAAIENGHVSRRRVGDGSSPVVLEALKHKGEHMEDELGYHTKTGDGRTLRSSTVYINDENGVPEGIFSINYDMTPFMMARSAVDSSSRSIVRSVAAQMAGASVLENGYGRERCRSRSTIGCRAAV